MVGVQVGKRAILGSVTDKPVQTLMVSNATKDDREIIWKAIFQESTAGIPETADFEINLSSNEGRKAAHALRGPASGLSPTCKLKFKEHEG